MLAFRDRCKAFTYSTIAHRSSGVIDDAYDAILPCPFVIVWKIFPTNCF